VAGKTFRGVGEDEDPSRRGGPDDDGRPLIADEDDARGLHSGPTVVDDQKVAEVLKKLRSLDKASGPPARVSEVVVDANSSEPTRIETGPTIDIDPASLLVDSGPARIEDVMYPLKRPTSIGRSLSTPVDGQPVTVPANAPQGTMFGRSIHVPDVNAPDEAPVELSSGAVHFLDGSPPTSQPFPLADRPPVVVPPPRSAPVRPLRTPYDVDSHTQLVGQKPKSRRFLTFLGALSLVGLAMFGWRQYGAFISPPSVPAPPAPTATATAPAVVALPAPADPVPAPTVPAPTPTSAEAAPSAAAPTPPPPEAAPSAAAPAPAPPAEEPAPATAPAPPRAAARSRSHRSSSASERRAAAKPAPAPAPPADDAEASKSRPHKRTVSEDPDATMAPSGE
jgi:hypothetical protein